MRLVTCLTEEHDWRLVALALLICALGAAITMRLYRRMLNQELRARAAWLFLSAVACGSTVWCTHFVAMLAYHPGAAVTYEPLLTLLSLVVALLGTGLGLAVASGRRWLAPELGGALVGAAIAAMHYTGMAAFQVDALRRWDLTYLAVSLVLAIVLGAAAFNRPARPVTRWCPYGGALLLVLAIGGLHFTGMAALTILPLAPLPGATTGESAQHALAGAVAGVAFLVLGSGFASHVLDRLTRDQAKARLRHLVESSVDGMVVEQAGRIIELNAAAETLLGAPREQLLGAAFRDHLEATIPLYEGELNLTRLRRGGDGDIPVELSVRAVPDAQGGELLVHAVRDLRPRLEQERRLRELARSDSLTGLANRAAFLAELDAALARTLPDHGLAVLSIDLDDFKLINDLHGHTAGDAVLRAVAERLVGQLGGADLVARLGGDAFGVLALRADRDAALDLAERLRTVIGADIALGAQAVRASASIGIALAPGDGVTAAALLNNAELAMARAASSPGDAVRLYDARADDQLRERRRIIGELREALAQGQFELRYQVQVRVADGTVTGYEALLRWRHPERGEVPPDRFVPLAEETGLIVPIGAWALRTACAEAAAWPLPHKVAVNLSAVQLGDPDLPGLIADALATSGLAPARLELEITETAMIADRARTTSILERIKALGVAIAMDDFGTGHSSLATLRAFAFDKIKLDRSFMAELDRGPQAAAVIRAVLALGSSLHIPVLAEGVETAAQLAFLREQGCDEAQGYLLGRPEPAAAVGASRRIAAAVRPGLDHALAG
jgi:diguanylate cyclase (GGDEF)-like protein/PAS domain S-box-containing protein